MQSDGSNSTIQLRFISYELYGSIKTGSFRSQLKVDAVWIIYHENQPIDFLEEYNFRQRHLKLSKNLKQALNFFYFMGSFIADYLHMPTAGFRTNYTLCVKDYHNIYIFFILSKKKFFLLRSRLIAPAIILKRNIHVYKITLSPILLYVYSYFFV